MCVCACLPSTRHCTHTMCETLYAHTLCAMHHKTVHTHAHTYAHTYTHIRVCCLFFALFISYSLSLSRAHTPSFCVSSRIDQKVKNVGEGAVGSVVGPCNDTSLAWKEHMSMVGGGICCGCISCLVALPSLKRLRMISALTLLCMNIFRNRNRQALP
jgi:hypothetical protein